MAELATALDALADTDLHALPAGAQLDGIRELTRARNRLEAEIARRVRVAETTQAAEHDGMKAMGSWLRGHCHLTPRAAGLLVRNGRALEHLPAVAAGCAAGAITADQLAIIAPRNCSGSRRSRRLAFTPAGVISTRWNGSRPWRWNERARKGSGWRRFVRLISR